MYAHAASVLSIQSLDALSNYSPDTAHKSDLGRRSITARPGCSCSNSMHYWLIYCSYFLPVLIKWHGRKLPEAHKSNAPTSCKAHEDAKGSQRSSQKQSAMGAPKQFWVRACERPLPVQHQLIYLSFFRRECPQFLRKSERKDNFDEKRGLRTGFWPETMRQRLGSEQYICIVSTHKCELHTSCPPGIGKAAINVILHSKEFRICWWNQSNADSSSS